MELTLVDRILNVSLFVMVSLLVSSFLFVLLTRVGRVALIWYGPWAYFQCGSFTIRRSTFLCGY